MMIGMGIGLTGLGSSYNPASLFTVSGSRGFMYDLSDYSSQFQDTAGTTPITATSQSVARVNDKSGLGNHATQATPANAPVSCILPSVGVRNRANGSAAPSGASWQSTSTVNGVTVTRVASGFDTDGLPFVDYSVSGTASSEATSATYFSSDSRVAATTGQAYTASFIAQVIAGTPPPATGGGNGVRADVVGETAPATFVEATTSSVVGPTSATVITATHTLGNAASNQARGLISIITRAGVTVSYTVRIKAVQFELGSSRTNYQFNYSQYNVTEAPFASVRGIQFDGVDDWLQTAAIDFSNSDEVTVVAGVRKLSDAARGVVVELGSPAANYFGIQAPSAAAGNNYLAVSQGTLPASASGAATAPDTSIVSAQSKISTDSVILRRNGTQVATSAADQGTGNFSNAVVYIGRRGGTSLPFNGVITFLFAINRLLTASELAAVERFANSRTGAF